MRRTPAPCPSALKSPVFSAWQATCASISSRARRWRRIRLAIRRRARSRVYLPPGYDAAGSRRYPALYVLHGYTGDVAALISSRPWETNVLQWADRLVREGRMPPAIVVLVDGFTRLGGSQYVDSVHNGNYATYIVRDVVGHVDRTYRTIAREGGRAVLGKSSGGFGAMHLVLEHPGVFAAFASHSGDSYFRYAHFPAFATVHRMLEAHQFDIGAFVEAFEKKHKRRMPEYTTMEMLAYAAAYSPAAATAVRSRSALRPRDRRTAGRRLRALAGIRSG